MRSDVQVFAGGITWVDAEYDERLGEVLRPLQQDKSGMPIGREMRDDLKAAIMQCFYLDKISIPPMDPQSKEMTAFEVGQRVQEYIRQALPIFEPMEQEYNGGLCDETFDLLLHNGAFGSVLDIPRTVLGSDIQFRFESPLTDLIDAQKGAKLVNATQLLGSVAALDPTTPYILDWSGALRDKAATSSRTLARARRGSRRSWAASRAVPGLRLGSRRWQRNWLASLPRTRPTGPRRSR